VELQQKTILVTGGASGLGAACVRLLTQAGAQVVVLDLNAETGDALVAELGSSTRFSKTNVADEADVQNAIKGARDAFGAIHGVINCAGIVIGEKVVGKQGVHSLDAFTKVLNVNLIGTFNVIRLVAAAMIENQPGSSGERGVII